MRALLTISLFCVIFLRLVRASDERPEVAKIHDILSQHALELAQMKSDMWKLKEENKILRQQNELLQVKVNDIEANHTMLMKMTNALTSKTDGIDKEEEKTDGNSSEMDKSNTADRRIDKRLLLPVGNLSPKQSFSVTLSKSLTHLGNNQAFDFDHVITNIGHGYSPNTGAFTANANGTYFFLASVVSNIGVYLQAEIVKNGDVLVHLYCEDTGREQGTNGVVVQLNVGDEVWVRHTRNQGDSLLAGNFASFSGFRISD